MGQLTNALRAQLKTIAESDARALRELDLYLKELRKQTRGGKGGGKLPGV